MLPAAPATPAKIERYTILGAIGAGGMAELFLAERSGVEGSRRRVVLKRILPAFARDPDFRQRFVHEARIAMQLHHANVVAVYDFRESDDTYLLEMEWVEGCDVRRLLRERGPLPLGCALHVCVEVLRGLDYAHRRVGSDGLPLQIVHRDVSPGNILLSREGEVKLTDFGLARSRERGLSVGGVRGTFAFMAPEQALGLAVDARADVFAVGAVLYALLAGASPFEEEGPVATLDRVREARYEPLSDVAGSPPELDLVMARALARDVEDRYASAAAMREAVESYARAEGLSLGGDELGERVRSLAPVEMSVATANTVPSDPAAALPAGGSVSISLSAPLPVGFGGTQLAPRKARSRWRWIAPAVAGLLLVGGGAVAGLRYRSYPAAPPVVAIAQPPPPIAAPPPTPATAPPVAAVTPPAPQPAPPPAHEHSARAKPGYLTVSADPWAYVLVDGKRRGTTPLRALALPPGTHEVTLENPPLGALKSRSVHLASGEHRTVIEKMDHP